MYVSMVDAGTVEFLRSLGKEIVSSADLVSQFEAVLSEEQIASHAAAQRAIDAIVAEAWKEIGRRLRPSSSAHGSVTEFDMVVWLGEAMRREGLVWENGPDVSVNANTSDSHYEPTAERSAPIREGDFLLIDIWGRVDSTPGIPSSTTSPGPASSAASRQPKEQLVFETVRNARDAAIAAVEAGLRRQAARSAASRPTTRPAP
jgi:Xaa-Pro dipeptidase